MSAKATRRSSSYSFFDGISPLMIRQNKHADGMSALCAESREVEEVGRSKKSGGRRSREVEEVGKSKSVRSSSHFSTLRLLRPPDFKRSSASRRRREECAADRIGA